MRSFNKKVHDKAQARKKLASNRGFTDEVKLLKYKIRLLARLPDDFRNLIPGAQQWQDYAWAMGSEKAKEMNNWLNGPIFLTIPLTKAEAKYYNNWETKFHFLAPLYFPLTLEKFTFETFKDLERLAQAAKCSFIYLPQFSNSFVSDLNKIATYQTLNFRWKPLMVGLNNKPLGEY